MLEQCQKNKAITWKQQLLACILGSTLVFPGVSIASGDDDSVESLVYYGDSFNDKVYVVDIANMRLLKTFQTEAGPYPVDLTSEDTIYISTRKANSIGVIDNHEIEYEGIIELQHKPRSTHYNKKNGLALISGADKPMTTMVKVKHGRVMESRIVGRNELVSPTDNGGSLATGHPHWVNKKQFFLLDREARKIALYNKYGELLSEMATPTSVHHIVSRNRSALPEHEQGTFYASAEGSQAAGLAPSLIRFDITADKQLILTGVADLVGFDPTTMGSHHADFDPSGQYIYMGSTEGNTFIVDKDTMEIVKVVATGKGAGHTTFSASRNMAIVTNHGDTFLSIINTSTHEKIADVTIAGTPIPGRRAQSHTSSISPDGKYFYSTASSDGVFYELDLDTLTVTRTLNIGGYPIQGVFSW